MQDGGIRSVSHELRLHAAQGTSALHGPFLLHCAEQRRYHLLFAADYTRQHDRMLPAFLAKRGMHQILCAPTDIEQFGLFLDDISQHDKLHGQTARLEIVLHLVQHFIPYAVQLILADTRDLRNGDFFILYLKVLEIHVEQLIH